MSDGKQAKQQVSSYARSKGEPPKGVQESSKENKPMNRKLDISKLVKVVERNNLDNDRLQQKAEARKSDSHITGQRLESDKSSSLSSEKINNNCSDDVDNIRHQKDGSKTDNYQHMETENGAVKRKKKKKRKGERSEALTKSETKGDDFDYKNANSNSKSIAGNRFSCVDGPRIPKR